jgi:NitT/TauT family transport system ATP-binding protein
MVAGGHGAADSRASRGYSVELRDVGMVFRTRSADVEALRGIDLAVRDGEFISIVGPSGCGKSTLLRIVSGLARATSGETAVDGVPVTRPHTDVGIVFQRPVLLDWRSVLDNVMLQIEARRLPRESHLVRAQALLKQVGLAEFERAYPHELSGGMSQRVSVCRALVHDPRLLLMDEPFGALDALTRDQMMIDLQRLWMGSSKTVLFVTHSVPEAIFLSDRVVVITPRPGRIHTIVEVDLPRPRRLSVRTAPAFGAAVERILAIFQSMGVLHEDEADQPDPAESTPDGSRRAYARA